MQTKEARNWYDTVPDPVLQEDGKTLAVFPDQYYDHKKQIPWNRWDLNTNLITEFTEKHIEGWMIGNDFIAYSKPEVNKVPPQAQAEVKADQEQSKVATEKAISKEAVVSDFAGGGEASASLETSSCLGLASCIVVGGLLRHQQSCK